MYHSKQPRTQLLTGAPRIEEGEILRRNQHQRAQQTVERESTDKLTSYGQIKDQKHDKSTSIQEVNILSWPENQGILFFVYFSNISNEPDIFHGCTS